MHPCPGNLVAIGRTVVYYVRAVHPFSAGIKCRHCICTFMAKLTTAFIRTGLYIQVTSFTSDSHTSDFHEAQTNALAPNRSYLFRFK